jgi:UPF0716 family protein affecting phage T7 exclusion
MKTTWFERSLLVAAGLVLVYPSLLEDLIGLTLFALAAAPQYLHPAFGRRPTIGCKLRLLP